MSWKMLWPMIIFHMFKVMSGADFGCGFLLSMFGVGGSVARASAAKVSMMRFTHKSCTAVKTDSSFSFATAEMKVSMTAVILTVTWNYAG